MSKHREESLLKQPATGCQPWSRAKPTAHEKTSDEDEDDGSQHCDRCEQLCVEVEIHIDGHHMNSGVS